MKPSLGAIGLVLLAAAALPSSAHDHATGVVKERMDAMTDMDKRYRAIIERVRSKRDLASTKADAEAIATLASHISHLFPKGSNQAPTRARGAVWQNPADFESKARTLETASRALASASPSDAAALGQATAAVSRACDSCHEKYRTRR